MAKVRIVLYSDNHGFKLLDYDCPQLEEEELRDLAEDVTAGSGFSFEAKEVGEVYIAPSPYLIGVEVRPDDE